MWSPKILNGKADDFIWSEDNILEAEMARRQDFPGVGGLLWRSYRKKPGNNNTDQYRKQRGIHQESGSPGMSWGIPISTADPGKPMSRQSIDYQWPHGSNTQLLASVKESLMRTSYHGGNGGNVITITLWS